MGVFVNSYSNDVSSSGRTSGLKNETDPHSHQYSGEHRCKHRVFCEFPKDDKGFKNIHHCRIEYRICQSIDGKLFTHGNKRYQKQDHVYEHYDY